MVTEKNGEDRTVLGESFVFLSKEQEAGVPLVSSLVFRLLVC